MSKPRLTWKERPRIGRAYTPETHELRLSGEVLACVVRHSTGYGLDSRGWFWYAPDDVERGIPHVTTAEMPVPDLDTAKRAAQAYIERALALHAQPDEHLTALRRAVAIEQMELEQAREELHAAEQRQREAQGRARAAGQAVRTYLRERLNGAMG